jgi:hypothetical protein
MLNGTRFDYRQDITEYSDQELSLHVFNDEYYYNERNHREYLLALVAEQFKYTDEQLSVLLEDLDDDKAEQ